MTTLATKSRILEDAGYVYNFDRLAYVNRKAKKVFSIEFVEDHSGEELENLIREDVLDSGWQFYSNSQPSEAVKRELERVFADETAALESAVQFAHDSGKNGSRRLQTASIVGRLSTTGGFHDVLGFGRNVPSYLNRRGRC